MSPLNFSPGARSIVCASATASAGEVTPQRCGARIALDQHQQLKPSAGHCARQTFHCFLRVRDDLEIGPSSQRDQTVELGLTDEVVGQEDVGDAGVDHDLRFAELLTIDAFRAELDLELSKFRDLVSLDMWAKVQSMTVEVGLTAPEIVLHRVEIDHRARRVQVLNKHLVFSFDRLAGCRRTLSGTGRDPTMAT